MLWKPKQVSAKSFPIYFQHHRQESWSDALTAVSLYRCTTCPHFANTSDRCMLQWKQAFFSTLNAKDHSTAFDIQIVNIVPRASWKGDINASLKYRSEEFTKMFSTERPTKQVNVSLTKCLNPLIATHQNIGWKSPIGIAFS